MTYIEKIIDMLPDAYIKDEISNNYKLLSCITPEYDLLFEQMVELEKSLDIDYAYGGTLEKIAHNVNQVIGVVNDVVLRTLIKAKIAADMSEGTIDTLLAVTGFIVGDNENKSQIRELYNDPLDPEPAAFEIKAPLEGVVAAGITLNQFLQLILHVKAAGVRVIADFQGTFEFGTIDEYGTPYEYGFATDKNMSDGGSLGLLYDPENDDPLPI